MENNPSQSTLDIFIPSIDTNFRINFDPSILDLVNWKPFKKNENGQWIFRDEFLALYKAILMNHGSLKLNGYRYTVGGNQHQFISRWRLKEEDKE